jgi:hypothetical protein
MGGGGARAAHTQGAVGTWEVGPREAEGTGTGGALRGDTGTVQIASQLKLALTNGEAIQSAWGPA